MYRARVAGRRSSDHRLEHVAYRRLLLERFGEILGALAQLAQEAGVLDGDHGLGGELLQQVDLLFGKRPPHLPEDHHIADDALIPDQRHGKQAARAADIDERATIGFGVAIGLAVDEIDDLHERLAFEQAGRRRARAVRQRLSPAKFVIGRRKPIGRRGMELRAIEGVEHAEVAPHSCMALLSIASNTGARSPAELEITRRTSDCLILPFQRLLEVARARLHFIEQSRVLDRDHGLVGKGSQQLSSAI